MNTPRMLPAVVLAVVAIAGIGVVSAESDKPSPWRVSLYGSVGFTSSALALDDEYEAQPIDDASWIVGGVRGGYVGLQFGWSTTEQASVDPVNLPAGSWAIKQRARTLELVVAPLAHLPATFTLVGGRAVVDTEWLDGLTNLGLPIRATTQRRTGSGSKDGPTPNAARSS